MLSYELIIKDTFSGLIGRLPEESSMKYWSDKLTSNEATLLDLIAFLKCCPEGINNIDPNYYEYILKYIYEKSGKGSASGNPFVINNSKYNLFFLHIPKAAGISIINLLANSFHPLQIKPISFGDISDAGPYKLFVGHCSINEVAIAGNNCIKVTSVRDPKERILSLYNFLQKVDEKNKIWGKAAYAARNHTLPNFLEIKDHEVNFVFNNYYTRVFSGKGLPSSQPGCAITITDVEDARHNLSSFDHIIKTEDLNASGEISSVLCSDLADRIGLILNKKLEVLNKGSRRTNETVDMIPEEMVYLDYLLLDQHYRAS